MKVAISKRKVTREELSLTIHLTAEEIPLMREILELAEDGVETAANRLVDDLLNKFPNQHGKKVERC